MRKREPYERLADGTIRFHDNEYESWKSLFQRAGYDIDKITTEEQYREAHSKVGDMLMTELVSRAAKGEPDAIAILKPFLAGDISGMRAAARRATFEVLPGGAKPKGSRG